MAGQFDRHAVRFRNMHWWWVRASASFFDAQDLLNYAHLARNTVLHLCLAPDLTNPDYREVVVPVGTVGQLALIVARRKMEEIYVPLGFANKVWEHRVEGSAVQPHGWFVWLRQAIRAVLAGGA